MALKLQNGALLYKWQLHFCFIHLLTYLTSFILVHLISAYFKELNLPKGSFFVQRYFQLDILEIFRIFCSGPEIFDRWLPVFELPISTKQPHWKLAQRAAEGCPLDGEGLERMTPGVLISMPCPCEGSSITQGIPFPSLCSLFFKQEVSLCLGVEETRAPLHIFPADFSSELHAGSSVTQVPSTETLVQSQIP